MNALNIPLPTEPGRRTLAERRAVGRSLRERVPRSSHAAWSPAADRPDPINLLEEQDRSRLAQFVPIRYGRMIASPFGFLRGSAVVMASDLAATPVTGLLIQMCGDAHLIPISVLCGKIIERNICLYTMWKGMNRINGTSNHTSGLASVSG